MRKFIQPSIGKKIYSIIGFIFACVIVIVGIQVQQLKSSLEDQRRNELRHLGEVALNIVQEEYSAAERGAVSADEAKKRAAARLSVLRYGHDDYFWINDLLPRMIMHPVKPELNGRDLSEMQDPNGKRLFVEFVEVVKAKGSGFVGYDWPKPGAEKPQPKLSFVTGFTPWGWVIGTGVYIDDLQAQIWSATERGLFIALGLLLFATSMSVFVIRRMARAVRGMTAAMSRLAAGEVDVPLANEARRDEIGEMGKAMAVFKQNAIERFRLEAEQKEIEARGATQRAADMHRLADEFQAAVGNIVNAVSSASTELEGTAGTLTQTAATTQQLSTTVAAASEEASTNVQSVATAAEQLSASVAEISRQVHDSSKIATEAVEQAEQTDVRINELSQASSRIGNAVKIITAIADQTNLLALNATIEAARAGDAGRGFAIVATEVKALAAQTAKATEEIGQQIAEIQGATRDSVEAIKEIGLTIGRISEISTSIAAAIEEQGATTVEISRNVQQAARGTTQVAASITDVNRGAHETGSASTQVLTSARSLSNESQHLKLEVDKFLSRVRAA
jgi:methyl-accepting chemotaxis protein